MHLHAHNHCLRLSRRIFLYKRPVAILAPFKTHQVF